MSSGQRLRESIMARLAAVSQEITSAFEQTIDRYKAEMDCQRRLLDVVWKPDIQLRRADHRLLDKREENQEDVSEQQPRNQEGNSCVEEQQVLGDQQEPGCSQEQDQLSDLSHSNNRVQCDTDTRKMSIKCEVCGKAFKLTFHLKRHLRRHSREKPYP